jgi:hypothetical protein
MGASFPARGGEESIEALAQVEAHGLGEMGVDLRAGDAGVAHKDLDCSKVNATFEEVRGEAVAKRMRRHALGQPRS